MAGLKKKKKEKSGSPNVVLVVFLVLFVLTAIGLGVWGYYGYAGQDVLRSERRKADLAAKSEKNAKLYFQMLTRDQRQAIGGKFEEGELLQLDIDRDEFLKDNGAYKDEPSRAAAKAFMGEMHETLGGKKEDKTYDKTFMEELKNAREEIKKIEGATKAEIAKHDETKKLLAALTKNQEKAYQAMKDKIEKDNIAQEAKLADKSKEFKDLSDAVLDLNAKLAEAGVKATEKADEYEKELKRMGRMITFLKAEKNEKDELAKGPGAAPPISSGRGELFPLMLDISPGKPLWDVPVGKVIRVDLDLRQVVINLGEAHGVKPELTFNVFGPNSAGKAEKQMKGSIEVIKVLGPNSSQCRITSLYDSEGSEILNLKTRGQILRETEAPMKEGDLLFNLFWGTRVAVAGYVSITGESVNNPAEQFRQMDDFMALCKRNGMIVDAYVDMRSGEIKGKINAKTRYLIRGYDLAKPGKREAAPVNKGDDKEMPAEKKEDPAPANEGGLADRIDQVNRSSYLLRSDAKDKGLLLISAENFAVVIGYRKVRSANSAEFSTFRPQLPYAGAADGGVRAQPEVRPAEKEAPKDMPKEEKKDEKKEAGN